MRNDVIELMTFSAPESSDLLSSARTRTLRRRRGSAGTRAAPLAIGAAARAEEVPAVAGGVVERARGDMAAGDERERERRARWRTKIVCFLVTQLIFFPFREIVAARRKKRRTCYLPKCEPFSSAARRHRFCFCCLQRRHQQRHSPPSSGSRMTPTTLTPRSTLPPSMHSSSWARRATGTTGTRPTSCT